MIARVPLRRELVALLSRRLPRLLPRRALPSAPPLPRAALVGPLALLRADSPVSTPGRDAAFVRTLRAPSPAAPVPLGRDGIGGSHEWHRQGGKAGMTHAMTGRVVLEARSRAPGARRRMPPPLGTDSTDRAAAAANS
jgi:hypothetical protein